jgi:hypothetical protein
MREYQSAVAITPSDSVNLVNPSLAIIATVAGTIKVDMLHTGTAITITLLAGVIYPLRVKKIYSTGTAATGITALY